ncbi:TPA: hypothetical protein N0F65_000548 [Lagenidium giganteum]|uniref:Uncharacterized protein n=1 Tax=Lagenidium giganteum TaxID=4803 RepID=A0AAV2Z4T7_9STRA|nr:TPA: hypothetical protein N0F65_000548 [Lagenidium giganteum]
MAQPTESAGGTVASAVCRFCVAFGRENHGVRQRKVTKNIKFFKFPFRTDNYLSHMDKQHRDKWAEYRELPTEAKLSFFDAAAGNPNANAPAHVAAVASEQPIAESFGSWQTTEVRSDTSRGRTTMPTSTEPVANAQLVALLRTESDHHRADRPSIAGKRRRESERPPPRAVAPKVEQSTSSPGTIAGDAVVKTAPEPCALSTCCRLINVILTDFGDALQALPDDADSIHAFWSAVKIAYHSDKEQYNQVITDLAVPSNMDASAVAQHSADELRATWRELTRAYKVLQTDFVADGSAQDFADVCGGRFELVFLHSWMLLKPELTAVLDHAILSPRRREFDIILKSQSTAATPDLDTHLVPDSNVSLDNATDTSSVVARDVPSPTSEQYQKLKREVLEQKKKLLEETYANERRRNRDQERRALLTDLREVVLTITDLRKRIHQDEEVESDLREDVERDLAFLTKQRTEIKARLEALAETM